MTDIATAPDWLIALVTRPRKKGVAVAHGATGAVAMTTDDPRFAGRCADARTWLEKDAPPSVQGSNGSAALWDVALMLVRSLELPHETCAALVTELYNPRCTPPWSDFEIAHKLQDARTKGERPCGGGSPYEAARVFDRLFPERAQGGVPRRKMKTPGHAYTHTPGDRAAGGEREKISLSTAISDLLSLECWAGVLQWDDFRMRAYAVDPPVRLDAEAGDLTDSDGVRLVTWFEANGKGLTKATAFDAALAAAQVNRYHPVREYLDGLPPAETGVFDRLAQDLFGTDDTLADVLLCKMMVGAVRRILNPGEKVENVLVLYGKQDLRKSTFAKELFGADYYRTQMPDIATKEASGALRGYWGIELAEMHRLLRTDPEVVKEFLSRDADDYRPPYDRTERHFPRQCTFIGTTNEDDFLRDVTGNRRMWPIHATKEIDWRWVRANRDRMWSAAAALARLPVDVFPHYLVGEEKTRLLRTQAAYEMIDPWTDAVITYLAKRDTARMGDLFVVALGGGDVSRLGRREELRLAGIMRRLGWERYNNGKNDRGWRPIKE